MGKTSKKILKKAGGKRELTQSVLIAVLTVFVALTLVFVIYPDALVAISNAFQAFQDWVLSAFGL